MRNVLLAALCVSVPGSAQAQAPARFSLDSAAAIDVFRGENTVRRPNIIVDLTGVARLGGGWMVYVRPWFRQPRAPEWDIEIYQAALQYERPGAVALRMDLGYIVSPIGLGMMDTRPGVNPTISPHLTYLTPMPVFDPPAPRISPLASAYPLGAQLSLSRGRWDARGAVVVSAPTRVFALGRRNNPKTTPAVIGGAGLTPATGVRIGVTGAYGTYVNGSELRTPGAEGRTMTIIGVEGEYEAGYTKISGEVVRDRLETGIGTETAFTWFVQGMQTLSPRWFAAARQEGASAPPLRSGTNPGARFTFHTTEATVGFRLTPGITFRGSFMQRKAYSRRTWDQQAGASVVWAHRWW